LGAAPYVRVRAEQQSREFERSPRAKLEGGAGRTRLDDPDEGRIERVGLREGDMEENGLLLGLLQIGGQRFLLVKIEEANLPVVEIVLDGLHAVTLSPPPRCNVSHL
jgi:hypothetical protein